VKKQILKFYDPFFKFVFFSFSFFLSVGMESNKRTKKQNKFFVFCYFLPITHYFFSLPSFTSPNSPHWSWGVTKKEGGKKIITPLFICSQQKKCV